MPGTICPSVTMSTKEQKLQQNWSTK